MLRSIFFSFVLVSAVLVAPFTTAAIAAEPQTVTLYVPGMTCKFCPITIRKALKKVPGVIDARSDYETKTATVTFDPATTNVEALTKATENVGYHSTLKQK